MKKIIIAVTIFLCLAGVAKADFVGDKRSFYVDKGYDASGRTSINAILVKSSSKANIYVDELWWNFTSQTNAQLAINNLGTEFDNKIYPTLTNTFGQEWNPGIDKDPKITILIQSMKDNASGYFRTNDEYEKLLISDSNEREMIYINSKYILDANLKSYVAHEFTHLITFYQKNEKYNVEEDTWLNEARAEYAPTLLLYNDSNYEGSYLDKKVQYFSEKPDGSLVDWQNTKYDYGRAVMFAHYLVDQYGINILIDSLSSPKVGIESINYALKKNEIKENFFNIFSDWTIAVVVNDCSYGPRYCYLDKNLKNFYLSPYVNFLPMSGNTTLTFTDTTKYWTGNWYKIIGGGGGSLKFSFNGDPSVSFKVPYLKKNKSGDYTIGFMVLSKIQKGEFFIENFGKEAIALFIIPVLQNDVIQEDNNFHNLSWSASISRITVNEDSEEIKRLQAIIDDLKKQIADIQAKQQGGQNGQDSVSCSQLDSNLYFGLSNNNDAKCLQEFLKNQGTDIYPEGLVTGYFGSLTKRAVIRFQEKYASEILNPIGLFKGTGYVGVQTRTKINQLLK
jgi:peptidoglycan hydrolase-like protein with peptidoglycan-binding domain